MGTRFNMLQTFVTYKGKKWEESSSREAFRAALAQIKRDYPDRWGAINDSIPAVRRFDELKYALPKMQAVLYKICLMLGDLKYGTDIRLDGKTKCRNKFTKPDREVRFSTKHVNGRRVKVLGNGHFAGTTANEDEQIEALREEAADVNRRLFVAEKRAEIKKKHGLTDAGLNALLQEIARD